MPMEAPSQWANLQGPAPMSKALCGTLNAQVRPAHAAIELMLRPRSLSTLEPKLDSPVPSALLLAITGSDTSAHSSAQPCLQLGTKLRRSHCHLQLCLPASGTVAWSSLPCAGGSARDLEEGMPRSPSERDPLCSLATNRGNNGMQGKWRLAIAIVLCTLFMIGEVGWPGLSAMQFVAFHWAVLCALCL